MKRFEEYMKIMSDYDEKQDALKKEQEKLLSRPIDSKDPTLRKIKKDINKKLDENSAYIKILVQQKGYLKQKIVELKKELKDTVNQIKVYRKNRKEIKELMNIALISYQKGVNMATSEYKDTKVKLEQLAVELRDAQKISDLVWDFISSNDKNYQSDMLEITRRILEENGYSVDDRSVLKREYINDNLKKTEIKKSIIITHIESGVSQEFKTNNFSKLYDKLAFYVSDEVFVKLVNGIGDYYLENIFNGGESGTEKAPVDLGKNK